METMFMQNFEGQMKSIMVFLKVANNCNRVLVGLRPILKVAFFMCRI